MQNSQQNMRPTARPRIIEIIKYSNARLSEAKGSVFEFSTTWKRYNRKVPRRARRGALMPAALLAVLVITILLSQFGASQLRRASAARSEARAVQIATIAADFDYYMHEKRTLMADDLTQAASNGRPLTRDEQTAFEDAYLRAGVARQIPGFELDYLISRGASGDEVFGALRLTPRDERGRAELCALIARLARHGDEGRGSTDPGGCDAETMTAYLIPTAPLSGVNPAYVLREERAGHPASKFVGAGALDLNGRNLVNVGSLTALGGGESAAGKVVMLHPDPGAGVEIPTLHTRALTGTLAEISPIAEDPIDRGGDAEVQEPEGDTVTVEGTTRAAALRVEGTLTSGGVGSATQKAPIRIAGLMTLSRHINTDALSAASLSAGNLIATEAQVDDFRLSDGDLTMDTLRAPAVTITDTPMVARQVFTEQARVKHLQFPQGGCTGC